RPGRGRGVPPPAPRRPRRRPAPVGRRGQGARAVHPRPRPLPPLPGGRPRRMTTALAMLFDGPGRPLRPAVVPVPRPEEGEVLVRVEMCTLCGSDLHTFSGRRSEPCPTVLGHEVLGRVEALPEGAAGGLSVGERVVWSVAAGCGACFFCA